MNNHMILLDIRRNALASQEEIDDRHLPVSRNFYIHQ